MYVLYTDVTSSNVNHIESSLIRVHQTTTGYAGEITSNLRAFDQL